MGIDTNAPFMINPASKGERGDDGISVKLVRKNNNLIAEYSNGTSEDLGSFAGANGISPSPDEVANIVISKIKLPKDGISPDPKLIVEEVLSRIRLPEDGKDAPSLNEILEAVKPLLPLAPEPIEPDIEDIVAKVLSRIPKPKDGTSPDPELIKREIIQGLPVVKDGVSPDPQLIIQEVLSKIKLPRDGKDAPFSTWLKLDEVSGNTNPGAVTNILFKRDIDKGSVAGVKVLLVGKGPNKTNFFFGEKYGLFYRDDLSGSVNRVDQDIAIFNPRRSNPALNFEIQLTQTGFQVIAYGLEDEEIAWKGEVYTALL